MSNKKLYTYCIIFLITTISWCCLTPIMFSLQTEKFPLFYYVLRIALLVFSILLILNIASVLIKKKLKNSTKGLVAIGLIFLLLFYSVEIFFTCFAQTNGLNDTYTSVTWRYKYWQLNSDGFRDSEFKETFKANKTNIFFAGDSYTEGHGIKNPDDRFSNIIKKEFPNYNVFNIGKCGYNIIDEMNILTNLHFSPEYIFLQLCENDWDYLFDKLPPISVNNTNNDVLYAEINLPITKYSIFFNYLHSNWNSILERLKTQRISKEQLLEAKNKFRINEPIEDFPKRGDEILDYIVQKSQLSQDSLNNTLAQLTDLYKSPSYRVLLDENLFNDYLDKLVYLNDYCKEKNTKLILIPFPHFDREAILFLENYLNTHTTLLEKLKSKNLSYIDVLPDLQKADLKYYRVNKYDAHANEESNKIIANTIIKYMRDSLNIIH